ncbi:MAG TPA: hypothetical protein VNB22_15440 [Pyrinomonadaceae bacterium]|jgi:hypothetical protein|nr:hypothetical protein [Pyrinomonadaceae bacterium]
MNAARSNLAIKKTHPKTGLISCGLAIVTGAVTLLLFVASFIPERGTYAEQRFNNIFLVFGAAVAPLLHFTGLLLGIIGAFIKDSKKVFPILGIILNGLPLIFALFIWILLFWVIWAVLSSGGGWM